MLAGATMTVLVAWACAMWSPEPVTPLSPRPEQAIPWSRWGRTVPAHWPATPNMIWVPARSLGRMDVVRAARADRFYYLSIKRAGWPLTALESRFQGENGEGRGSDVEIGAKWMKGIRVPETVAPGVKFLPVVPRWFGLVFDTAFYAAVCWAVWAAPGAVRGRMRTQRGQCARCGYDVRGISGACPECGVSCAASSS
jgi:hypothetical protein